MPRFHVADLRELLLSGAEAHHCTHVLRLKAGAEVELFDGRGQAVRCRISQTGQGQVRLEAVQLSSTPPLPVQITLAVGIIKKNFDFIVQKATELGVAAIAPLITERTIVRPDKADRWQEIALEACKQCGNNWLPTIRAPQSLSQFLAAPGPYDLKLVAALQPEARPFKSVVSGSANPVVSAALAIGPEGDFTPNEYAQLRDAGYQPITLGPLVLRADTAALYALSVLHHELIVPTVASGQTL